MEFCRKISLFWIKRFINKILSMKLIINHIFKNWINTIYIKINHFGCNFPYLIIWGTYAAIHGPKEMANACAIPNLGEFLAQRGAKWISWHIFPPRYILIVFP